jgi:hypothetical protein
MAETDTAGVKLDRFIEEEGDIVYPRLGETTATEKDER